MNEELYKARASVAKALAHESRLKIITILSKKNEVCVTDFVEVLNLSQPSVSKHLSVLRNAGLVSSKKQGLNVIYKLEMTCTEKFFECIDETLLKKIKQDHKALGLDVE